MINKILITNYCDFSCNHCVSCEIEQEDHKHISIENLKYLLNFVKDTRHIVLGGGDPLLHPDISKILELVNKKRELHFIFESHLIYNEKEINFLVNKFINGSYTIILNAVAENYEKKNILINNINLLKSKDKGIKGKVIIDQDTDVDRLLDVIREIQLKEIIWELGLSAECSGWDDKQVENYYTELKQKVLKLINFGIDKNIDTQNECGNIPICFLSAEDLRIMAFSSDNRQGNVSNFVCEPNIIFTPDMLAFRCKNIGEYVDIKEIKNFKQLYKFFINELDRKEYGGNMLLKCDNCLIKDKNRKCGCLIFKEV